MNSPHLNLFIICRAILSIVLYGHKQLRKTFYQINGPKDYFFPIAGVSFLKSGLILTLFYHKYLPFFPPERSLLSAGKDRIFMRSCHSMLLKIRMRISSLLFCLAILSRLRFLLNLFAFKGTTAVQACKSPRF